MHVRLLYCLPFVVLLLPIVLFKYFFLNNKVLFISVQQEKNSCKSVIFYNIGNIYGFPVQIYLSDLTNVLQIQCLLTLYKGMFSLMSNIRIVSWYEHWANILMSLHVTYALPAVWKMNTACDVNRGNLYVFSGRNISVT